MRKIIFFIYFFPSFFLFSQKSEIVLKSSINHNYVIGNDYYVEDAIDTARLMFMGTIKITCINDDESIANAQKILKTKSKELNGNSYKLKSFVILESTIAMFFDVYFASETQIEIIKLNSLKEKIVIFNNYKLSSSRLLIVNGKRQFFLKNKRFEILTSNDITLNLDSTISNMFSRIKTIEMKKDKKAVFLTIRLKDDPTPAIIGGVLGGAIGAAIANSMASKRSEKVENEFFSKLNYNTGRILMAIFPID